MLRRIIIFIAALTLICFIVALALAAQNKKGVLQDGTFFYTSDLVAAYGLLGTLLGIITTAMVFVLDALKLWKRKISVIIWIFFSGITLFFLCGAIGIWSAVIYEANFEYPRTWNAEFSFEVISAFFKILLMSIVVSMIGTRKTTADEPRN